MTKRERLRAYLTMQRRILGNLDEVRKLRRMAERCTVDLSSDGIPAEEVATIVARMVDLEKGIQTEASRMKKCRETILQAIERVSDERLQQVLRLRYINGGTWEWIADVMGYSRQWVAKLHADALKAVHFERRGVKRN